MACENEVIPNVRAEQVIWQASINPTFLLLPLPLGKRMLIKDRLLPLHNIMMFLKIIQVYYWGLIYRIHKHYNLIKMEIIYKSN